MSSLTPSIRISQPPRYHSPPNCSTYGPAAAAAPVASSHMAIPRTREKSAPPPLPPPSHFVDLSTAQDPGWQWGNGPEGSDFGGRAAAVKPGSGLVRGGGGGGDDDVKGHRQEKEHDFTPHRAMNETRRGSSISTVTLNRDHDMTEDRLAHSDEDGNPSRPLSNYRLQSEKQLEQRSLEDASNTYDKQLLSRIGGPNTPKRQSVSHPGGGQEAVQVPPTESELRNGHLRPLSLPERRHTAWESPSNPRWPSSGAVSPGFTGFWSEQGVADLNRGQSSTRGGSLAADESISHRGSYDQSMFVHEDLIEAGQMDSLKIHDRSPPGPNDTQLGTGVGTKRRASSPQREASREERSSISSLSGQSNLYHRRSMQQLPNRGSPVSRLHPNHSSVSSVSSLGLRHGSLGSSLGISSMPSSATSHGSGRLSPNALSPAMEVDQGVGTPYSGVKARSSTHQRALSDSAQAAQQTPPDNVPNSHRSSVSHLQGIYICQCCPKKPKKFDTQEELRSHEAEKQYTCAYCSSRFKNKNEAERHQNSLHLRRHSWSCAALAGLDAAFHTVANSDGGDVCGYCGDEFPNPPQWVVRAEHLHHVHKFDECNQAKKFFRADHFRQHLKHSHGGTSGKWTNVLETTCMLDEPPPVERVHAGAVVGPGVQVPPALSVTTQV